MRGTAAATRKLAQLLLSLGIGFPSYGALARANSLIRVIKMKYLSCFAPRRGEGSLLRVEGRKRERESKRDR